ncbi:hypothetical protein HW561_07010 [Rhodobacteraceae bacterium B1Z28]|uniref:Uncharacterized protein n=1 Tax=Ruegeria haliotis TaxID=2747601 RepID=A0ABX2PNC0_9RHOB|nr:hypothetical protein [Ruegeria haliotis]NVO55533.1 hypothetical protein [Ruegeria haliotis]
MNANRIINMIVRQVMRRLVTRGVDKGFDLADRVTRKPGETHSAPSDPEGKRRMAESAGRQRQNMKQAQQLTRQMRRFMKF